MNTVLFLAANPKRSQLDLETEFKFIDGELQKAKYRDWFDLRMWYGVEASELQEQVIRRRPRIVHFAGHGEAGGLIFEKDHKAQLVDLDALADFFRIANADGSIRCVVLNACYSEEQAKAISRYVDCVIGMSYEVSDEAAKKFAAGFYRGLGAGSSISDAFSFGVNELRLEGMPESQTPRLNMKEGTSAQDLVLVPESSAAERGASDRYKGEFLRKLDETIPRPRGSFELTYGDGERAGIPISEMLGQLARDSRVLMQGDAGGGKTHLIRRIAKQAFEAGRMPVLLNLKYMPAYVNAFNSAKGNREKMDILLKVSLATVSLDHLEEIEPKDKLLLVDGLNEVPAGGIDQTNVKGIMDELGEYTRQARGTWVVVADRPALRAFVGILQPPWKTVRLEPLSEERVERVVSERFGRATYDRLSAPSKELLRKPYFLDSALASGQVDAGYAAAAIEAFFRRLLHLGDAQLDKLAWAALNAYVRSRGRSFDLDGFREDAGEDAADPLVKAGVLKVSADGKTAEFDHQLKHDYLASRHMSRTTKTWSGEYHDAVSLDANSLEVFYMVLEQLADADTSDLFLKSVYDWYWPAIWPCMQRASSTVGKRYSDEMEVALLSVVLEKRFDPVRSAQRRVDTLPSGVTPAIKAKFDQVGRLEDMFTIAEGIESTKGWYSGWREMFTRYKAPALREEEISRITDGDPLIGWTAANVMRRFSLSPEDARQLRTIYRSFRGDTYQDGTVRFRVTHALGPSTLRENASLLFEALDGDAYSWTRYGAARSLVEIAARTDDAELRREIVDGLTSRMAKLSRRVREEISRTVFYGGAPPSWAGDVKPLMEAGLKAQTTESDVSSWKATMTDFETFCQGRKAHGQ